MCLFCMLQCGVIECVPNSKSRDQLGQSTEATLTEYFVQQYGVASSSKFQEVRLVCVCVRACVCGLGHADVTWHGIQTAPSLYAILPLLLWLKHI